MKVHTYSYLKYLNTALTLALTQSTLGLAAEDTAVLPKGIFRGRIVGIQTQTINERFNSDGNVESLTQALNRSVTVNDLVANEPKLGQLVGALNNLQAGIGNQLAASELYATSDLNVRQTVPALEYGISDRVTLGMKVFIVSRNSVNRFAVEDTNNAAAIREIFGSQLSPDLAAGLDSLAGKNLNTAFFQNSLFTSKGYEAPSDFNKTQLGDIDIGAKYNFYKNSNYSLATQYGFRLPTGTAPSLTNIFDTGSGGGALSTALSVFQDVYLNPDWIVGAMVKGWYHFPDTRQRAIPRTANEALPSLLAADGQVQDTQRVQGATLETEVSTTMNFFDQKFQTWAAYQYAQHGQDRFEGPGNLYYEGLSRLTDWNRSMLELGLSLYTVPWFKAKQFPIPGRLSVQYNATLNGKNSPIGNYGRMDIALFF